MLIVLPQLCQLASADQLIAVVNPHIGGCDACQSLLLSGKSLSKNW